MRRWFVSGAARQTTNTLAAHIIRTTNRKHLNVFRRLCVTPWPGSWAWSVAGASGGYRLSAPSGQVGKRILKPHRRRSRSRIPHPGKGAKQTRNVRTQQMASREHCLRSPARKSVWIASGSAWADHAYASGYKSPVQSRENSQTFPGDCTSHLGPCLGRRAWQKLRVAFGNPRLLARWGGGA